MNVLPMRPSTYADLRHRHLLFTWDRARGALLVLLRYDADEAPDTRAKLTELGFVPDASPVSASIHFCLTVREDDIARVCSRVRSTFGEAALLDVGAVFDDSPARFATLPRYWNGELVVHVGGSRRCVVFSPAIDPEILAGVVRAEREAYFDRDLSPATE